MGSKPNNSKILMNDFERLNSKKVSFIDAPVYYPLEILLEMSHIATMNQLFLAIVHATLCCLMVYSKSVFEGYWKQNCFWIMHVAKLPKQQLLCFIEDDTIISHSVAST